MTTEPAKAGSGNGNGREETREALPHLTEVVPDFKELSPLYLRPNSAPAAAGTDLSRYAHGSAGVLEHQRSDIHPSTQPSEPPLPPLVRRPTVRTHPGAGSRPQHQGPFDASVDSRTADLDIAIQRSQSDRPPQPRRQATGDTQLLSPSQQELSQRSTESRPESKRPSVYDPIYEVPQPPRRESRGHLPPIETGIKTEAEGPPIPQYTSLPPIRAGQPAASATHPQPSPRYAPYPGERPSYESSSRRRYSQTATREYARPPSPHYNLRSPPRTHHAIYPQEPYPPYPPTPYNRGGTRRPSLSGYSEERRPSRQESHRYPAPIPYGSSYPHPYPYEYGGGRSYYDPYTGYLEYPPDRRLSQQEPGEQVTHLGVPERGYRPQMVGGPTSPSSIRVQPPPHATGITTATPGKRRGNLPKESKEKLKLWLSLHVDHPYPTEDEKKELAAEAGMTMGQINNWFINARRRTLPRIPGRSGSPNTSRTLRRRPGDS